jgi:hypothetical protein
MATFVINQDVTTTTPTIEVTMSATNPLPIGRHTFRLVVVDDSGNKSAADDVQILIVDTTAPTAVLGLPKTSPFGQSFTMDGSKSFDAGGGKVAQYVWTYLGPVTLG